MSSISTTARSLMPRGRVIAVGLPTDVSRPSRPRELPGHPFHLRSCEDEFPRGDEVTVVPCLADRHQSVSRSGQHHHCDDRYVWKQLKVRVYDVSTSGSSNFLIHSTGIWFFRGRLETSLWSTTVERWTLWLPQLIEHVTP